MESTLELKKDKINSSERHDALKNWLRIDCQMNADLLKPMPHDASLRRYYRVQEKDQSFVVMDAPPPENTKAFFAIAKALAQMNVRVPDILQANLSQGFLLISDLGDLPYLDALTKENADELYNKALNELLVLQTCATIPGLDLPVFDAAFMLKEWDWHKEWFLEKWLGIDFSGQAAELDKMYAGVVDIIMKQPQVFMHRDYHAGNLMVLPDQSVGVLDFQDAFIGPVTYDLVSLLRDCYVDWPQTQVEKWLKTYANHLRERDLLQDVSDAEFLYWFDMMSIQRHLKALMTFARKHVRDQQSGYLAHIPRTLNYLLTVSAQYPETVVLNKFLLTHVQPALKKENL